MSFPKDHLFERNRRRRKKKNFCFRCGECCRKLFPTLRVTSEEAKLLESETGIKLPLQKVKENRFTILLNVCPFQKDKLCSVHKIRPTQCRLFHCGKLSLQDKPLEWLSAIQRLMKDSPEYFKFKEQMEKEAVEWGNAHGWNWRKINGN